jgi:glyceraldehyde 3-phosphate dehydrogenase
MNIAINGFGRIGRVLARQIYENGDINLVFINDIIPSIKNIAYLLKYDSTYGRFPYEIECKKQELIINKKKTLYSTKKDIYKINYKNKKIDVLIDSSGIEENINLAKKLIKEKKIRYYIFTMSSNLVDKEIIYGFNDKIIKNKSKVLSASICDANAISHFLNYFEKKYKIVSGSLTTLHPWLSYQNLLDGAAKGIGPDPNKYTPRLDKNRHLVNNFAIGRSSVSSIIPKETTAVAVCEKLIPKIKNKIISHSFRIPTSVVSCAEISLNLKKYNKNLIKDLHKWVENHDHLELSRDICTSKDFEKKSASAILDANWTKTKKNLVKFVVWYDNEWGYSSRVIDLAKKIIR